MVSRVFPKSHPRSGQLTNFVPKILSVCGSDVPYTAAGQNLILDQKAYYSNYCFEQRFDPKRHTIRGNYDLWAKRAEKINRGEAVLSLRHWSGEPYKSKQVEFMQLEKIGVEKVKITNWRSPEWEQEKRLWKTCIVDRVKPVTPATIAKNDGLSIEDFHAWFPKDFDGVIIHFTPMLYANS